MFLEEIIQYGEDAIASIAKSNMSDIEQNMNLMRIYSDMLHAWTANELLTSNREHHATVAAAIKSIKTQNILLEQIALTLERMVMKEKNT